MAKVLVVIARLNVGGTAQYIGELAKNLAKHGHEVLVATGYVQGAEIEDEVANEIPIARVNNLGRKVAPLKDLRARAALKGLIHEFKPDFIYSQTFKAGLLVRTLKLNVPVVHAFHGHLIDEPELAGIRVKVAMALERWLAPKAKYLVTVGERVAKELVEKGVGTREQYISIAPGVNPLQLLNKEEARRALGLKAETRPIVAWLARVVAVKGPHRVLELARKIPEARFILAGGGDLLEEVRANAPENLSVLGWQEAEKVWAVADLAISTSENEGMPVALIEAQLAGLPIVALDVGSVAEVIKDQVTGFVFDELDDGYFEAVKRLIEEPRLRRSMGGAAKQRAIEYFSPERFTQQHLRLIDLVQINS